MESENDQFMRHAVQPRFDNVAAALGALRHLRTGHQAFGTNVGAIEAAVKLLADRTAAIVIALKGHPDQVRRSVTRQKTIGAWKAIVRARELQRTEPLAEASAPPIYRLPLALLQKIGESLETQLLDETAEVLRAFEKIARCTAGLLWEVDEHNIGGALKAMRTRLDEIQGILDFVTSLMRQVMPPPWDPDIEKREAQRRWALQTDPSSSSSWLLGDLSDADSSREVNLVLLHTDEGSNRHIFLSEEKLSKDTPSLPTWGQQFRVLSRKDTFDRIVVDEGDYGAQKTTQANFPDAWVMLRSGKFGGNMLGNAHSDVLKRVHDFPDAWVTFYTATDERSDNMLGNAHSDALKRAQNLENLRSAIMRKASARLRHGRKAAALRNERAATPALSPTALEEAEARARVAEAELLAMLAGAQGAVAEKGEALQAELEKEARVTKELKARLAEADAKAEKLQEQLAGALDLEEPEAGAVERSGSAKGKGQGKAKGKLKGRSKGLGGKR